MKTTRNGADLAHGLIEQQLYGAEDEVMNLMFGRGEPCVIVQAPPGSGKTGLVTAVTAIAVLNLNMRVAVISARWEQIFSLVRRLAHTYQPMKMQLLAPEDRQLPDDIMSLPSMLPAAASVRDLDRGPGLIAGSAAKFLVSVKDLGATKFDLLIVDEANQLSARELAPQYHIAKRLLMVGDPGQLRPLARVDTTGYEAAAVRVHWSAPAELMHRLPTTPTVHMQFTRRLTLDTTRFVRPAFYPELNFTSLATTEARRLTFKNELGGSNIDRVLSQFGSNSNVSLVAALLPGESTPGIVDHEVAELAAGLAQRLLQLRATWSGVRELTANDIACLDSHVVPGAGIRRKLRQRGISTVRLMTDTPEIMQGLERPVILAVHPLTGATTISDFNLDIGRWCVMLSRHQVACIIIGRTSITESLRNYRPQGGRALGADDSEWSGLQAHRRLWESLENAGRLIIL